MFVAQPPPVDRQRLPEHRLGRLQLALLLEHEADVVEAHRHLWIVGSEHLAADRQCFAHQRLCRRDVTVHHQHRAEIVQAGRRVRMLRAERLLPQPHRLARHRYRLGILVRLVEDVHQPRVGVREQDRRLAPRRPAGRAPSAADARRRRTTPVPRRSCRSRCAPRLRRRAAPPSRRRRSCAAASSSAARTVTSRPCARAGSADASISVRNFVTASAFAFSAWASFARACATRSARDARTACHVLTTTPTSSAMSTRRDAADQPLVPVRELPDLIGRARARATIGSSRRKRRMSSASSAAEP